MSENKTIKKRVGSGFTLVEMLMVILVISFIAAVVVPKFEGDTIRVEAGARMVQSTLELAQSEAMRRSNEVRVDFSTGSTLISVTTFNMMTGMQETIKEIDLGTDAGMNGLTIKSVSLGGGTGLVFQGDGTVLNGWYSQLPIENKIVVGNDNNASTISINPITATITIK